MQATRLSIPDVLPKFQAFAKRTPGLGALHSILEDGNVNSSLIAHCQKGATGEEKELLDILSQLSKTQRLKLGSLLS